MNEFFTGYDPTLERRDEIANSSTPMMFTMRDFQAPDEVDPRPLMRHDKQFNMGSCQGFSLTNCGEYLWALPYGSVSKDRQFSQLFAYLESQRFDRLIGKDEGSTISGGVKVAKEIGYLPESELPYRTPYPSNSRVLITDAMRKLAEPFRIRSHTWLESYEAIFQYLASGSGAVHTGTAWNDSFYSANGVLESVRFGTRDGGHATAWLGYSKRKDSRGRNYIWRLNSHNDSWTEIAPSVIDALCRHSYTSIVGISDLSTPGPRKMDWLKERPLG